MKIIQLTDTHILAEEQARLAGVKTRDSCRAVRKMVLDRHSDAVFMLHTGDMVQDVSIKAYRWLLNDLAMLNKPVYCIPGNHDDPVMLKHALGSSIHFDSHVDAGGWRFIFLVSSLYGSASGHLSKETLGAMRTLIESAGEKWVTVCLHHHPLPMGSAWLDTMTVDNGSHFMEILSGYTQVKAVLYGHVHQASDCMVGHIRVMSAPSTCFQFKPGSEVFSLDALPPGYRWLALQDNGEIDTGIERLPALPEGLEQATAGY